MVKDFIKDFSNCREAFVETQIAYSYKIERSLANYLRILINREQKIPSGVGKIIKMNPNKMNHI